MRTGFGSIVLAVLQSLLLGNLVWADTLFVGELERKDIHITGYRHGMVEITVAGHVADLVHAGIVTRIMLDDDPLFTDAETAYVRGDWDKAAEGYSRAMRSASRPWLTDWSLPRLLDSANRGGKMGLAASAFCELIKRDAAKAMKLRPVPDAADQNGLSAAASVAGNALRDQTNSAFALRAMGSLMLDVRLEQNDLAAADELWSALGGSNREPVGDAASADVEADICLGGARLALAQNRPADAKAMILGFSGKFEVGRRQAMALDSLARAEEGLAGEKVTLEARKDMAIAYARAAAAWRGAESRRGTSRNLLRVAEIERQLGDTAEAQALYEKLAREYKDCPAGATAAAALQ